MGLDACNEASREHNRETPVYANTCCPKVVLAVERLTKGFCPFVVAVGRGEKQE